MPAFTFDIHDLPKGKLGIAIGTDTDTGQLLLIKVSPDGHIGINPKDQDEVLVGDQLAGVADTFFEVLSDVDLGVKKMGVAELRDALEALGRADVLDGKDDAALTKMFLSASASQKITGAELRKQLTEIELERAKGLLGSSTRPFALHLHRVGEETFSLQGMWMQMRKAHWTRWRRGWVAIEASRAPVVVAAFTKEQWPAPSGGGDNDAIVTFRRKALAEAEATMKLGTVTPSGESDITLEATSQAVGSKSSEKRKKRRFSLIPVTSRWELRAANVEERDQWIEAVREQQERLAMAAMAERAFHSTTRSANASRRFKLRKALLAAASAMVAAGAGDAVKSAMLTAHAASTFAAVASEDASLCVARTSAEYVLTTSLAATKETCSDMEEFMERTLTRIYREDALARNGMWMTCKRAGLFSSKRWVVLDAGTSPPYIGIYKKKDLVPSIQRQIKVGDLVSLHGFTTASAATDDAGGDGTADDGVSDTVSDAGRNGFNGRYGEVTQTDVEGGGFEVRVPHSHGASDSVAGQQTFGREHLWLHLRQGETTNKTFAKLEGPAFDEAAALARREITTNDARGNKNLEHAFAVDFVELLEKSRKPDARVVVLSETKKKGKKKKSDVWILRAKSTSDRDAWLAGAQRALQKLRDVNLGRPGESDPRRLVIRRALLLKMVSLKNEQNASIFEHVASCLHSRKLAIRRTLLFKAARIRSSMRVEAAAAAATAAKKEEERLAAEAAAETLRLADNTSDAAAVSPVAAAAAAATKSSTIEAADATAAAAAREAEAAARRDSLRALSVKQAAALAAMDADARHRAAAAQIKAMAVVHTAVMYIEMIVTHMEATVKACVDAAATEAARKTAHQAAEQLAATHQAEELARLDSKALAHAIRMQAKAVVAASGAAVHAASEARNAESQVAFAIEVHSKHAAAIKAMETAAAAAEAKHAAATKAMEAAARAEQVRLANVAEATSARAREKRRLAEEQAAAMYERRAIAAQHRRMSSLSATSAAAAAAAREAGARRGGAGAFAEPPQSVVIMLHVDGGYARFESRGLPHREKTYADLARTFSEQLGVASTRIEIIAHVPGIEIDSVGFEVMIK